MTRWFVLLAALLHAGTAAAGTLRVCADPNNLPFSNKAGQGFENKLAEMIAAELGDRVSYTWWAQRRGYIRNTLKSQDCDLWPGISSQVDMVTTSVPYYRSSYMFVTRRARALNVTSLDDAKLRDLVVGVQLIGNDAENTPPAHALARRGIVDNVRGYMLYGDYSRPNPPAAIVDAVARRKVDVAIVWGPLAGYFAARSPEPLTLAPVTPATDGPWPMQFDVSVGMRKGDSALKQRIDAILARRRADIDALLARYHVPRVDRADAAAPHAVSWKARPPTAAPEGRTRD